MRRRIILAALIVFAAGVNAEAAAPAPGTKFRDCPDCPEMIVIPPGSFTMGSPPTEEGRFDFEGPQHRVTIGYPFAAEITDVTRGEYAKFVSETSRPIAGNCNVTTGVGNGAGFEARKSADWTNPGFSQTDHDPVVCVSWLDAKAYIAWLNGKLHRSDTTGPYRLLTEAEWEYAARAGTSTIYYWGSDAGARYANCNGCDPQWGHGTSPVSSFPANPFGLYDISGNVWQWIEDCYHKSYDGAPADGSAWATDNCPLRMGRGGSWFNKPSALRLAFRGGGHIPYLSADLTGIRVAKTLTTSP